MTFAGPPPTAPEEAAAVDVVVVAADEDGSGLELVLERGTTFATGELPLEAVLSLDVLLAPAEATLFAAVDDWLEEVMLWILAKAPLCGALTEFFLDAEGVSAGVDGATLACRLIVVGRFK